MGVRGTGKEAWATDEGMWGVSGIVMWIVLAAEGLVHHRAVMTGTVGGMGMGWPRSRRCTAVGGIYGVRWGQVSL